MSETFLFPLSFAQERLWFLEQLHPGLVAYNLAGAMRLAGPLDVPCLREALRAVIARHESLRTRFVHGIHGPQQSVTAEIACDLQVLDLSAAPVDTRERQALQLASVEGQRPFDLARGPLLRLSLYIIGPDHHILMLAMHHIITDGWSLGIFMEEVGTAYDDLSAGRDIALTELPIQYPDYAEWQRNSFQGDILNQLIGYWRERLEGAPAILELPTDHPRPTVEGHRGADFRFGLPLTVARAASSFARQEHATLFMVLLSAFKVLLFRYTGQTDVVVGSPIAGRDRPELEGLIGCFVNTLVLRSDLSGDPPFRLLLAKVRGICLGAYAHQGVPFEKLVEELQPTRDTSHNPIFQVAFALQNAPFRPLSLRNLEVSPLDLERHSAQFDLLLQFEETTTGLAGIIEYSTDLFEAGTIERMAGHFVTLLSDALADPDRKISDLRLLTDVEHTQIVTEWNRTEGQYSTDTTLTALIEAQVDLTPDAVAVVSAAGTTTYRQLDSQANRIANYLRKIGIGPGAVVAVFVDRSIDLVAAQLGILKASAAYVPIDAGYPHDRITYMLDDAGVSAILARRQTAASLPKRDTPVLLLDDDVAIAGESSSRPSSTATPEDLAYVIYTSGSTGKPKGAMIPHRAIVNHVLWMRSKWPLCPGDAVLQNASPSFDASVWEIWNTLASGARLVIGEALGYADPAYLVRCIMEQQVTHALLVPSVLELVAREPEFERCTSFRCVFSGGEALKHSLVELLRTRRDIEVVNLYGPTETTINTTAWVTQRAGPFTSMEPIGRPITNHRAYILDGKLRPVPVGVAGELHVGGMGVGLGYLRRPELTAEKFIADPFVPGGRLYKTGDVCRFRSDGVIEYLERNDFQVKIRGYRIELGEIEAALSGHASVSQAVVVARKETNSDARLVAYVVARSQGAIDAAGIRAYLHNRLPEYMVPSTYVLLDGFPLNHSGKADRNALPAPDATRPSMTIVYEAPRNELESRIAEVWKEVLRIDKVGIHDNFFDLGGHSLLLTTLRAQLERCLERKLTILELLHYPCIEALSCHMTGQEDRSPERERIETQADRQRQAMNRARRQKAGGRP